METGRTHRRIAQLMMLAGDGTFPTVTRPTETAEDMGGRTKIMSHGRGSAHDQETRRDPEAAEEAPNCQSAFGEDGDITPV